MKHTNKMSYFAIFRMLNRLILQSTGAADLPSIGTGTI
jgi:hypothetical protein